MATIAGRTRYRPFCAGAIVALSLAGCGIPSSMGVRTGSEPSFQDDDVRFRTTYFFRVFDYCQRPGRAVDDPRGIRIDSLYRFRMTGKANALFNDIVFESGTLKAQEIDPFGAKVAYDKANRSFYFQSRAETERAAACSARDAELDRLRRDYVAFSGKDDDATKIRNAIADKIAHILANSSCGATASATQPGSVTSETAAAAADAGRSLRAVGDRLIDASGALGIKLDATDKLGDKDVLTINLVAPNSADGNKTLTSYLTEAGKALSDAKPGQTSAGLKTAAGALGNAARRLASAEQAVAKGADGAVGLPDAAKKQLRAAAKGIRETGLALEKAAGDVIGAGPNLLSAGSGLGAAAEAFAALARLLGAAEKALDKPGDDAAKNAYETKAAAGLKGLKLAVDDLAAAARELRSAGAPHMAACVPGEQLRRGFQVLGPEGFRTFDQDDRLLMAMSSKASPLIAQLKDISGRVLAEQTAPGDALLALVRARLKVSQTLRALDASKGSDGGAIKADDIDDNPVNRPNEVDALTKEFKPAVAP